MKYRKILLAYNGSQEGKRALFECADLASFLQAETHLLAVASMPPSLFLTEGFVPEELLEEEKKRTQTVLDEERTRLESIPVGDRSLVDARLEIEQPAVLGLEDEHRLPFLQECDAGKSRLGEPTLARSEAKRLQRRQKLYPAMRRREALREEGSVERHPLEPAQAADQPGEMLRGQRLVQDLLPRRLCAAASEKPLSRRPDHGKGVRKRTAAALSGSPCWPRGTRVFA